MSILLADVIQGAVISIAPLIVPAPSRGTNLEVRVSAPAFGSELPVIIFSHGNGQSLHAYGPLINHWASRDFVVFQPTHLDSRLLGLAQDDGRRPHFWRYREEDILRVLENLDEIANSIAWLKGRLDLSRVAVAGHSWGGQTVSTLLGATHPDPEGGQPIERRDERIKAGVLLATPGSGDSITEYAARTFPFMYPDFSKMVTPTLVVAGDNDIGRLTTRGADWWRDAFDLSPSPKALFTAYGGEHALGGIPGYEARETTDENRERVSAIQLLTTAYLRSALYPADPVWADALASLRSSGTSVGSVEIK